MQKLTTARIAGFVGAVALVLLRGLCFPGGTLGTTLPKNRLTVVPARAQTPQ